MVTTVKTERGCGYRERGQLYSVCAGSPFGKPLEHFLCDPPIPIDEEEIGLTDVGVKLLPDADGTYHIWDIVGQASYRNVADYIEEMRYFLSIGREAMSRKLPRNLDFSKLTYGASRHILLHRHAFIENFRDFYDVGRPWICPKSKEAHARIWDGSSFAEGFAIGMDPRYAQEQCAGLWWQDVVGPNTDLVGIRYMPSFSYEATPPPVEPVHRLAIFARMPITGLAVIKDDRRKGVVQGLVDRVSAMTDLPVDVEDV